MTEYRTGREFAVQMDDSDPLSHYREKFHFPKLENGEDCLYFSGNSLGLMPKTASQFVDEELADWGTLGVAGHHASRRPWKDYEQFLTEKIARVVGGLPGEVVIMNALTVNVHLLLISFYRPTKQRHRILIEHKAFPSDQYAVASQVRFHGFDPADSIIETRPRTGEVTVSTEDILQLIEEEGDSIATVFLGGVNYYSGQAFDMAAITDAARRKGCVVGYDLAHAAGNIPLNLHDWNVDFAAWCTYKYLNSGPGSVAAVFIHERHGKSPHLPRFAGWWGHNRETRFEMGPDFDPVEGADGWQISNPPILSTAPLVASLDIFHEVGMAALRKKSLKLTGYMEFLLHQIDSSHFDIITPKTEEERGCQLSIRIKTGDGKSVMAGLNGHGVHCDFRRPDVIRVAPVPLYNSFRDVCRFAEVFAEIV